MKNFTRPLLTLATTLPLIFFATPKAKVQFNPYCKTALRKTKKMV